MLPNRARRRMDCSTLARWLMDADPSHQHPDRPATVCVLEQGFCRGRGGKPVHGVELFRIDLIRQLAEMGLRVTVPCERSWAERLGAMLPESVEVIGVRQIGKVVGTGVGAVRAAKSRGPFDVMLLGNPGGGLIPGILAAVGGKLARRYVVFAHREPRASLVRVLGRLPVEIVANSDFVASGFRDRLGRDIGVMYGLPNAELFYPRAEAKSPDAPIDFCLLGRLPGVIKGHDVALRAFERLPEDVRDRCRLHLASYKEMPEYADERIIAYPWMSLDEVAELLRRMDVLLCLSSIETFSQAIVQGMLTELPIIATPIPVFVEKIDPQRGGAGGHLVSGTDAPDEVSSLMARLARDPPEREALGSAGRRVAEERYVWSTRRFVERHLLPGVDLDLA